MEQLEVQNITDNEVAVMFDGMQVYFKPGQKKAFAEGVARGIANEASALSLVEDIEVAEEAKVVSEEPVEAVSKPVEKPKKKK